MENNIHKLGSSVTYKTTHIINTTEERIGNISFNEIKELLKDIPDICDSLEKAVQE